MAQDPADEPAETLLRRINPKWKPCDKSHYHSLPQGWINVKLTEVVDLLSGRDLKPTEYNSDGSGIPYVTGASNVIDNKIVINRWTQQPAVISQNGDLLITCKGTVGKIAFNNIGEVHIARQIMAIRCKFGFNANYLRYFIEGQLDNIKSAANSLIPGIDRVVMLRLQIPLPPINEQKRIVEKIEELFGALDEIQAQLTN